MAGARSIVVYGQPGSGKTALLRALEHRAKFSTPKRLVVHWRPALPTDAPVFGTPAARAQMAQVMDACAMALLEHLTYSPAVYGQAPEWAQQTLAWFIKHCICDDLAVRAAPLLDKVKGPGRVLLRELIIQQVRDILAIDAPVDTVVARLAEALSVIGIGGIWVMADGVERLAEEEPDRLAATLKAFFSNLAYFEQSSLFYKLALPLSLQHELDESVGVARRRVFSHQLQWTPELLMRVVERRIASAVANDDFKITDLYSPRIKKSKTRQQKSHPVSGVVDRRWRGHTVRMADICNPVSNYISRTVGSRAISP